MGKQDFKLVPREYFDDKITKGVSRGVLRHLANSRYCIVRMDVGFGKTLISVLTAVGIAKMNGGDVQIGVIAPKAKRLDNSFTDAIRSAEQYFKVNIHILPINGNETGTFAGLTTMYGKADKNAREKKKLTDEYQTIDSRINVLTKQISTVQNDEQIAKLSRQLTDALERKEELPELIINAKHKVDAGKKEVKDFEDSFKNRNTIFILDETHMSLRDATGQSSKTFKKLFNKMEKRGDYVRVVGLTATPTDKSVIDLIGYLVFDGQYSSRTAFYREEVVNYEVMKARGSTQDDIEASLFDYEGRIIPERFYDMDRVIQKAAHIIYNPDAPRDFHIPKNKLFNVHVDLDDLTRKELKHLRKMDSERAFGSATEKRLAFIMAMTANVPMLLKVLEFVQKKEVTQPLIFYQFEEQRFALQALFQLNKIKYAEVNGKSHSYFDDTLTDDMPVLVQYTSGATAFEAKTSNTSIYFGLPDSAINFTQSLGRNARRGQQMDLIYNFILVPYDGDKVAKQYEKHYKKMMRKVNSNAELLERFKTPWGTFESGKD